MKGTIPSLFALATLFGVFSGCASSPAFDVVLRGGTVVDGTGSPGYVGDLAIRADTIVAVGDVGPGRGALEIDASGLVVAPGFINMLSWAGHSLLHDGRSLSDISQGITLEVFGEGWSDGPLNEVMKRQVVERQGDITFDVTWTTLGEYLDHLVAQGVSPNVASFVGAGTVRIHELGYADRRPSAEELARMKALVRQAMEEGALGLGSSLIYAPYVYADTEELVALAEVVAEYDGMYISHLRSEGNRLLEAVDELIEIVSRAGVRAEIYHLKAMGSDNHSKLDEAIAKIDSVRAAGLDVSADMYTYTAASTGLDAYMPPWVQEGGYEAWADRLRDPAIRRRVAEEMRTPSDNWENIGLAAGAEGILLVGFKNPELRTLIGRTLASVSLERGLSPEETAIDLVIEDGSRVQVIYEVMSEENVRKKVALPFVAFGSDAASMAPEGLFIRQSTHPRAYGNVARLLGRYVREEGIIPLEEAVRRLTSFPASNLRIDRRGALVPGYFADVAVFDPETVVDHATFDDPHRLATGFRHVFVSGQAVLLDGEHTGASPGRVVRGPGYRTRSATEERP